MEIDKPSQNHTKDRVLRFKPVAFLRKNLLATIVIFLVLITNFLGVWNIKNYVVYDISGEEVPFYIKERVDEYIQKSTIGKNFFLLSTHDLEEELTSNISYIKKIDVKKSLPNRVELFVEKYEPELSFSNSDNCYILSIEGIVLENLCNEEGPECCTKYSNQNNLYQLVSTSLDISKLENGKEKLLIMDTISKIIKVVKSLGFSISDINLQGDTLEIELTDNKLFRFSLGEDSQKQLERLVIVTGKIKNDSIPFSSLDLRFERPVLKD